jgi:hypothetical protein
MLKQQTLDHLSRCSCSVIRKNDHLGHMLKTQKMIAWGTPSSLHDHLPYHLSAQSCRKLATCSLSLITEHEHLTLYLPLSDAQPQGSSKGIRCSMVVTSADDHLPTPGRM